MIIFFQFSSTKEKPPPLDDIFSPVSPDDVDMVAAWVRPEDTLIDAAHLSPMNTGAGSLGYDLLKMYQNSVSCDLVLVVGQKEFYVHR